MDTICRRTLLARVYLAFAILFLASCIIPESKPQPRGFLSPLNVQLPLSHNAYLPAVSGAPLSGDAACFYSESALQFYNRLRADSRQYRTIMRCSHSLVAAAKARAQSLVATDHWAHCDPEGKICANSYAEFYGCRLPNDYVVDGNNIESLGGGSPDMQPIYNALAGSPSHSVHLFARNNDGTKSAFFVRQTEVGIAVAEGGKFGWVWVILISECA